MSACRARARAPCRRPRPRVLPRPRRRRTDELELLPEDEEGPPPPPKSVYCQPPEVPLGEPVFSSAGEVIGSKSTAPVLDFAAEDCPLSMCGDIKIEVLASAGRHDERLLRFWFHTAMLTREKLVLRKWQLEGPIKDKKHKKWNPHFRVELLFARGPPDPDGRRPAAMSVAL